MSTSNNVTEESSATRCVGEDLPLKDDWSFWFDRYIGKGCTAQEYNEAMLHIADFGAICTFWSWFNNLPSAAEIDQSCTYHLMKKGIRPVWEDERNERGGSFSVKIPLSASVPVWKHLCVAAVSGQFDLFLSSIQDSLCGVSFGMRKRDATVYVWNANAQHFDQEKMCKFLNSFVFKGLSFNSPIEETATYKVHQSLDNFGNRTQHTSPPKTKKAGGTRSLSQPTLSTNPSKSIVPRRTTKKKDKKLFLPKSSSSRFV
jgi:hypothetical protein